MKNNRFSSIRKFHLSTAAVILASLLAGCGKSEIQTYRVAKEDSQSTPVPPHEHLAADRPAVPHVHSTVPEGWNEVQREGIRAASYQVNRPNGKMAQVAIIPLQRAGDIELQSINMWRTSELGLKPFDAAELKSASQEVQVGDTKGFLVDMTAETPGPKGLTRILGALARRGDIMWFVKMTGDNTIVSEQKDNFLKFLKSLEFHEASPEEATQVAANTPPVPSAEKPISSNAAKAPSDAFEPNFKVPANWTEKAPGPMILRAFTVTGDGGQAEVTISRFPGATGGMLPNVNRWRGQLGLPPIAAADPKEGVEMVEVGGKKDAYLVDVKGTNARSGKPARLVALGVPYKGETWFFKLLGDEAVVAKEKDAFVKFVVSAY
jgi:hypothetical protein